MKSRRRLPAFELTIGAVLLAALGFAGYAGYRYLSAPGEPVLPVSWARPVDPGYLSSLLSTRLFTAWHADPTAIVVLTVFTALYLAGVRTYATAGHRWPALRTTSFLAGIAVCVIATNGSIAVYDMALFSAHMVGHLMLVMLAPVLIVAGRPLTLLTEVAPEPWQGRIRRLLLGRVVSLLTLPPVALATYAAVIIGAHLTGVMNDVMRSPWAGQAEHLLYLLVGLQFFTVALGGEPIRWQLRTPARWLLLAMSMAVDTFVGVILIMSSVPIAMMGNAGLSLDPMSDTITGGAIMWVGGDGLMAFVMIALVRDWISDSSRRATDRTGWLEQAREQVFNEHVGAAHALTPTGAAGAGRSAVAPEFDEDDARLAQYNRWLAKLADGQ